jgi:hypothetical protein
LILYIGFAEDDPSKGLGACPCARRLGAQGVHPSAEPRAMQGKRNGSADYRLI